MARQRMLERCEWSFFRIRSCEFYANPEKLLDRLWRELDYRKIKPVIDLLSGNVEILERSLVNKEMELSENQKIKVGGDEVQKNKAINPEEINQIVMAPEFSTTPKTIKEALLLKPVDLRELIIDVLDVRPNNSCMKSRLATEVLKKCEIRTSGAPRLKFERKVIEALRYMDTQGYIEIYNTEKNERIKLGSINLPRQAHLLQ